MKITRKQIKALIESEVKSLCSMRMNLNENSRSIEIDKTSIALDTALNDFIRAHMLTSAGDEYEQKLLKTAVAALKQKLSEYLNSLDEEIGFYDSMM